MLLIFSNSYENLITLQNQFNNNILEEGSTVEFNWVENGLAVYPSTSPELDTKICSDGSGGAIMTWNDGRSGSCRAVAAVVKKNCG